MLRHTGNKQAVRILLECILVTGCNEVVAKVMFLQVSVILLTGGCVSQHALQMVSQHALQQVSRGCLLQGCLLRGVSALGGVCSRGVSDLGGVCSGGCLF